MCEYVDHLHEHFVDPVRIVNGRYAAPTGARVQHHHEGRSRWPTTSSRADGSGGRETQGVGSGAADLGAASGTNAFPGERFAISFRGPPSRQRRRRPESP